MNNQGMERLCLAIIETACKDYMDSRKAIVRLKKKMETLSEDAAACEIERTVRQLRLHQSTVNECLRFFRSKWFTAISPTDAKYLLRKMEEKIRKDVEK